MSKPYTLNEFAAALGTAIGKPVTYVPITYEALGATFKSFGSPDWEVQSTREVMQRIDAGENTVNSGDYKAITGQEPETMEEWVAANAAAFK